MLRGPFVLRQCVRPSFVHPLTTPALRPTIPTRCVHQRTTLFGWLLNRFRAPVRKKSKKTATKAVIAAKTKETALTKPKPKANSTGTDKKPPTPPVSISSTDHHDKGSFLQYAHLKGLSKTSNYYIGTHFEYTVQDALRTFDFALHRTGQSGDMGIDLMGIWELAAEPGYLKVNIQCKACRVFPSAVRELEGACAGASRAWQDAMGILVSARPDTKGVRETIQRSRRPMGFAHITKDGELKQFYWNHAATEAGLTGYTAQRVYKPGKGAGGEAVRMHRLITLLYDGQEWPKKGKLRSLHEPEAEKVLVKAKGKRKP